MNGRGQARVEPHRHAVAIRRQADDRIAQHDIENLRGRALQRELARDRVLHLLLRERVVIGDERKNRGRAGRRCRARARRRTSAPRAGTGAASARRVESCEILQCLLRGRLHRLTRQRRAFDRARSIRLRVDFELRRATRAHSRALVARTSRADGCKPAQHAGRRGSPKIIQRRSSPSWTQRTPAGLPSGMPGIGLEIDGAMQHAPQLRGDSSLSAIPGRGLAIGRDVASDDGVAQLKQGGQCAQSKRCG